jgi:hypothetical protein
MVLIHNEEVTMDTIARFVHRHPLVTFFVLAYAITWPLVTLTSISFVFPVLGLFGPALAAIAVAGLTEGCNDELQREYDQDPRTPRTRTLPADLCRVITCDKTCTVRSAFAR